MNLSTKNEKQTNYVRVLSNILIVSGVIFIIIGFGPVIYDNVSYYFKKAMKQSYVIRVFNKEPLNEKKNDTESVFSSLLVGRKLSLTPANLDFSLAVEKIGLSVPIVANVSVSDEKSYMKSLRDGVAHAVTSDLPSELPGNTYLFAHSSFDYVFLGKFSRSFNLIDKLEAGDRVNVFYKNKNYTYTVTRKEVLPGWNTKPLERSVMSPVLTLQSCYPPGTTLNRIVITAELYNVRNVE